jgi:phosphopantetheine--protein transferase-like protein
MSGPAHRRIQWLLGRSAVKDAVREFLRRRFDVELYPADIDVLNDTNGRPYLAGPWVKDVPTIPAISLAHTGIVGVGIAGGAGPDGFLGIDLERIRPRDESFAATAFTASEREILASLGDEARDEWIARLWCAKEALGKAVGHGLVTGPTAVSVLAVDAATGLVRLRLGKELARLAPDLRDVHLVAHTARDGELAVATTVCEGAR